MRRRQHNDAEIYRCRRVTDGEEAPHLNDIAGDYRAWLKRVATLDRSNADPALVALVTDGVGKGTSACLGNLLERINHLIGRAFAGPQVGVDGRRQFKATDLEKGRKGHALPSHDAKHRK
jgi:hypothetical protein